MMKNKIALLLVLGICLSLSVMTGCKKLDDEIIGTWNIMTFDTKPEGTMSITFDGSNATRIINSEKGMLIDSCTYEVIKQSGKQRLVIRDSKEFYGYTHLNGIYRVDKIKEDIIITTRIKLEDDKEDGAYYRLELKRKN